MLLETIVCWEKKPTYDRQWIVSYIKAAHFIASRHCPGIETKLINLIGCMGRCKSNYYSNIFSSYKNNNA
jgi:hypothetical protein